MPFGTFNPLQALALSGGLGGQGGLAGLLSPEDNRNAMMMGLLGAGSSLLESGGPNPQRIGLGQALGRGLQAGLGGYQGALQTNLQSRMAQQQFENARTQQELAQKKYGLDERRLQQQQEQDAAKLAMDRQKLEQGNYNLPTGWRLGPNGPEPIPGASEDIIRRAQAGRPSVTVNTQQESEESKTVGKFYGDLHTEIQKGAVLADQQKNRIDRLDQLLSQVNTGKFAGTMLELKKAAKSAGIDLEALGIRDDVAPAEAAAALSNEITLTLRNPAGGAGMPGAMSDADRQFLQSIVPGLETTPAGRALIKETMKRISARSQQVAKMATAYRTKNKHLDDGFMAQLQEFSAQNPLFADLSVPAAPPPAEVPDVSRETSQPAAPKPTELTPDIIDQMEYQDFLMLDPNSMDEAQLRAYIARARKKR